MPGAPDGGIERQRRMAISGRITNNDKGAAKRRPEKNGGTEMGKTLYIAYGSNLNLEQMKFRCPTAKPLGTAKLTGYQLLFRGEAKCAVATVEKKKGNHVPVLIWELEANDEKALDKYEGFPSFYRKEYKKVRLGGKWTEVMLYIMNDGRPLGAPGRFYLDTIMEGYKSAGFDYGVLDEAIKVSAGKAMA